LALLSLVSLITSGGAFLYASTEFTTSSVPGKSEALVGMQVDAARRFFSDGFALAARLIAAFYLLTRGEWLFKIMQPPSAS
jgi:hypothetical protein